ncbi:MAG: phosphopantetheine-binding protein [Xanthobacteraceae bacterium]
MRPIEIASAVERIVAAVVSDYGLAAESDTVNLASELHGDLGMDETDIIELIIRTEDRFDVALPDGQIGPLSTVSDIVDLIDNRLRERGVFLSSGRTH